SRVLPGTLKEGPPLALGVIGRELALGQWRVFLDNGPRTLTERVESVSGLVAR
ncbi:hypothetical protein AAFF_G00326300, partial [Aldrovandia affinis]